MNRRTVLSRCGLAVAGAAALSGCTEETLEDAETKPPFLEGVNEDELDLPVAQRADAVEAGVERAEGSEIESVDDLEAYLDDQGVAVESLSEVETIVERIPEIEREDVEEIDPEPHGEATVLELEFVGVEEVETGMLETVGTVAGGYAALVDAGTDAELLEATITDAGGHPFGGFDVLTAWATEYNDGIVSARAYGSKVWDSAASE